MSATDELRRLLDERGVEHDDFLDVTFWNGSDGVSYTASEIYTRGNKKPSTRRLMLRRTVTPEQAIAATLGFGECGNLADEAGWFECSSCGAEASVEWHGSGYGVPRFCPNCGRKVVTDG